MGELAALGRGGNTGAAQQAARARARAQQIAGYMSSIGCDRTRFLIFGSAPPAQCGPLAGQLQQARAAQAAAEARSGDGYAAAQRRASLQAALRSYGCTGNGQPQGLFESLFGAPGTPGGSSDVEIQADPNAPDGLDGEAPREAQTARGGSQPVCVRTCDGYFFPLGLSGGAARSEGGQLCQALCPEAQTELFYMQPGGDIANAVGADGTNYTALPAALAYRKAVSPDCTCKKPGESWAALLRPAQELRGDGREGDITVTPQESLRMARPQPVTPKGAKGRQSRATSVPAAEPLVAGDEQALEGVSGPDDSTKGTIRNVSPRIRR